MIYWIYPRDCFSSIAVIGGMNLLGSTYVKFKPIVLALDTQGVWWTVQSEDHRHWILQLNAIPMLDYFTRLRVVTIPLKPALQQPWGCGRDRGVSGSCDIYFCFINSFMCRQTETEAKEIWVEFIGRLTRTCKCYKYMYLLNNYVGMIIEWLLFRWHQQKKLYLLWL